MSNLYQTTKFWALSKSKASTNGMLNVTQIEENVCEKVNNFVRKGENARNQLSLLFRLIFKFKCLPLHDYFKPRGKSLLKNIVGKGENAGK